MLKFDSQLILRTGGKNRINTEVIMQEKNGMQVSDTHSTFFAMEDNPANRHPTNRKSKVSSV